MKKLPVDWRRLGDARLRCGEGAADNFMFIDHTGAVLRTFGKAESDRKFPLGTARDFVCRSGPARSLWQEAARKAIALTLDTPSSNS